nr:hypothetical protein [Tanacetum cinerariifolium]
MWNGLVAMRKKLKFHKPFVDKEVDLKDFDNEPKSDEEEFGRKKIIKKVAKKHKPEDGQIYTENFYVRQTF